MKDQDIFLAVADSISFVAFTSYFLVTCFKVKWRLYRPLLIVLIAYQVSFFTKVTSDAIKVWKALENKEADYYTNPYVIFSFFINLIFMRIKQFVVIYFMF